MKKNDKPMKKFLDMTVSGQTSCSILLYGIIGDYEEVNSADITREILEAEATYQDIDVRINSMGGEVYAGIAIFNALRNSKANVNIYVDGIAASMASVIALCGKPVQMSQYAKLMIHSVSGGCYGTTEEMNDCVGQMKDLENTLCEMYSEKCKQTPEAIRSSYFDGKDHWLTAQEALSLGFIDGIYDAEPVPEDSTIEQIYQTFNNRLKKPNQKREEMSFYESVKKHARFKDCTSDDDALRIVGELENEAAKSSVLEKENEALKRENKVFTDEAKAAEEASKKALLDSAEEDGRIDATSRSAFQALLDKDMESGKKVLAGLKPKRKVMEDIHRDITGEKSPWEKRMEEIREKRKN